MRKKDYLILTINLFLPVALPIYMVSLDKIDRILDVNIAIGLLSFQISLWAFSMLIDNNAFIRKQ